MENNKATQVRKPIEYFRSVIFSTIEEKKQIDPKYSLRKLAAEIDMNPGFLSSLLSEKRPLTPSMAYRIFLSLGFAEKTAQSKLLRLGSLDKTEVLEVEESKVLDLNPDATAILTLVMRQVEPITLNELVEISGWSQDRVQASIALLNQIGYVGEEPYHVPAVKILAHSSNPDVSRMKIKQFVDVLNREIGNSEMINMTISQSLNVPTSEKQLEKNFADIVYHIEEIKKLMEDPEGDSIYQGLFCVVPTAKTIRTKQTPPVAIHYLK